MSNVFTLVRNPDGTCYCPGVNFSNRKPMRIHEETRQYVVVYIPPGSYWHSLGAPHAYSAASYYVFKKLGEWMDDKVEVERVVDFPARPTKAAD